MVIWLRGDHDPLGLGQDVVRREELAQVLALDDSWQAMEQRGAVLLAQARAQAEALVAQAEVRAAAIVADAERRVAGSTRLGYAAGRQQGVDAVHAQMQARARDDRAVLLAMRERLVAIVYQAAQQLLARAPHHGLYQRAAELVGAELDQASFLTVTVHPGAASQVRKLFAAAGLPLRPTIIEDAAAGEGACLCEWDYGVLDAGLPSQLAALRKTLRQALDQAPDQPADQPQPAPSQPVATTDADAGAAA